MPSTSVEPRAGGRRRRRAGSAPGQRVIHGIGTPASSGPRACSASAAERGCRSAKRSSSAARRSASGGDRSSPQSRESPARRSVGHEGTQLRAPESDTMVTWTTPLPPPARTTKFTEDGRRMREVLTYSRRGGRFTPSQQRRGTPTTGEWVVPDEAVDDPAFRWAGSIRPRGSADRGDRFRDRRGDRDARGRPAVVRHRGAGGLASGRRRTPSACWTRPVLNNVRLLSVDAVWCLEHLFGPGEVEEIWTFFPDPWPKKRHHKRRLVTAGVRRARGVAAAPGRGVAAGDRLGRLCRADARRCSMPNPCSRAARCRAGRTGRSPSSSARASRRAASITDLAYRRV